MTWAGLLDICKQRETELRSGGKTGPMYYCQFRSLLNTVYRGKASGRRPRQTWALCDLSDLIGTDTWPGLRVEKSLICDFCGRIQQ